MATKIKVITAADFIQVTPDGMINITTSQQLLVDIAKVEHGLADYELFVDFRNTECDLSISNVYLLAGELLKHGNAFRRKTALLVQPGSNFVRARFFETCSLNRGFQVNAFTDYEKAMRWLLQENDLPGNKSPSNNKDKCKLPKSRHSRPRL